LTVHQSGLVRNGLRFDTAECNEIE
jgi:hypothetical protein